MYMYIGRDKKQCKCTRNYIQKQIKWNPFSPETMGQCLGEVSLTSGVKEAKCPIHVLFGVPHNIYKVVSRTVHLF